MDPLRVQLFSNIVSATVGGVRNVGGTLFLVFQIPEIAWSGN